MGALNSGLTLTDSLESVVAVVVTHNPEVDLFLNCVASLTGQVSQIIIVDNASQIDPSLQLGQHGEIQVISNKNNLGVAAAQNIGIRAALRLGADYILLSDQDSVYPDNYVAELRRTFESIINLKISAIGPKFYEPHKAKFEPLVVPSITFKKLHTISGVHEVMQMISSGMLIRADTLARVGLMNEDLFIDWVDLEWCWRARDKGFELYVNSDVTMQHRLGDGVVNLCFGKFKNTRAPLRHYYIIRNALYLASKANYLGPLRRVVLFWKVFQYAFAFPVFFKPRLENLRAVSLGLFDAMRSTMGVCKHKFCNIQTHNS